MHLAFCSDKTYLPWCAVPAKTAIEHTVGCGSISIHFVLSEDCRDSSQLSILAETLDHPGVSVYTYFVDESRYRKLPVSGHGTTANYFRLLIPDLLPAHIEKIIYLDCDLLVLDSLLPLWEIDLKGVPLAAVSNMSLFESEATRLDIPYMNGTFNSGVLVMNLCLFRQERFHHRCMDKAMELGQQIVYWDQDVLNILACGRWLKLENCWNVQHGFTTDPFIKDKYAVMKPKIIHFSGNGLKPWQSCVLPFSDVYMNKFRELGFELPKASSSMTIGQKIKRRIKSTSKRVLANGANMTFLNPDVINALAPIYRPIITRVSGTLSQKEAEVASRDQDGKYQERHRELITHFFPERIVSQGPFKGMRYPSDEAIGSAILPKLAGSYEIEMAHIFTPEFLSGFTAFFDIGCAEGYYAVGVAAHAPNIRVYAYDVNNEALRLCKAMADLNGVSNRVTLDRDFSLAKLSQIKADGIAGKCLILVDCEGAELAIFSSESYGHRKQLSECTVIIESHEFIRPGMADHIIEFFAGSHRLQRVLAVGDLLRPSFYSAFIPAGCDRETALTILAEKRPEPMEWLVFSPCNPDGKA